MASAASIRWMFSPDVSEMMAQLTRASDALMAAGMDDDPNVAACLADIYARSCATPCFGADWMNGMVVVSLVDDELLRLFAKFQAFADVAAARNRARHRGEDRR